MKHQGLTIINLFGLNRVPFETIVMEIRGTLSKPGILQADSEIISLTHCSGMGIPVEYALNVVTPEC